MATRSSLLILVLLLSACSVQQRRHALRTPDTAVNEPAGRELSLPADSWSLYNIKGTKTPLKISPHNGGVKLFSNESVGVYWHKVDIDTSREPLLAWRWQVSRMFEASSPWVTETDNFPARVLIGFDASWDDADPVALSFKQKVEDATGQSPPSRAICYTFGGGLSSNEAVDGSFGSGRVAVINLRNASAGVNKWRRELRDIESDYQAVFQLKAPRVSMLGIACDTHLVGGEASAMFSGFTLYPASARELLSNQVQPEALGPSRWRLMMLVLSSLVAALIAGMWLRRKLT